MNHKQNIVLTFKTKYHNKKLLTSFPIGVYIPDVHVLHKPGDSTMCSVLS